MAFVRIQIPDDKLDRVVLGLLPRRPFVILPPPPPSTMPEKIALIQNQVIHMLKSKVLENERCDAVAAIPPTADLPITVA